MKTHKIKEDTILTGIKDGINVRRFDWCGYGNNLNVPQQLVDDYRTMIVFAPDSFRFKYLTEMMQITFDGKKVDSVIPEQYSDRAIDMHESLRSEILLHNIRHTHTFSEARRNHGKEATELFDKNRILLSQLEEAILQPMFGSALRYKTSMMTGTNIAISPIADLFAFAFKNEVFNQEDELNLTNIVNTIMQNMDVDYLNKMGYSSTEIKKYREKGWNVSDFSCDHEETLPILPEIYAKRMVTSIAARRENSN